MKNMQVHIQSQRVVPCHLPKSSICLFVLEISFSRETAVVIQMNETDESVLLYGELEAEVSDGSSH